MYMYVHADGCQCSFPSHHPLTIGFFFQIPFKKEKYIEKEREREFIFNLNLPFLIRSIYVILCFCCRFVFLSVSFNHAFVFIKHMRMLSMVLPLPLIRPSICFWLNTSAVTDRHNATTDF